MNGGAMEQIKITQAVFETVQAALQTPCAMCGNSADWVMGFQPKDPERFGIGAGVAVYTPLCARCVADRNHDPEGFRDFIEEYLVRVGVRKNAQ